MAITDDDSDLLDLLSADHRRIEALIADGADRETLAREIEPHLVAESQLLYREMREQLPADDDQLIDDLLDLDHRIETELAAEGGGAARAGDLTDLFTTHVARQEEDAFPRLRLGVSQDRLNKLGGALQTVMRMAPTRPHPHTPDEGRLEVLTDAFVAVIDQLFHR